MTDDRKYKSWKESSDPKRGKVSIDDGILRAKKALNVLHQRLARDGFNQVYILSLFCIPVMFLMAVSREGMTKVTTSKLSSGHSHGQ